MGTFVLLSVLIFITCVLLVLIVLVQNAKGGGLASNFSSSNQVMGVRKTTDFLEKATWTLAIILLVLTLSTSFVIPRGQMAAGPESEVIERVSRRDFDRTQVMDEPMEIDVQDMQDADPFDIED